MTESRLKKSLSAGGRETRASQDASRAPAEETFVSAQERRKMWSDEWTQSALPKLPEMTWIKVTGIATFPIENGRRISVLKAERVEKTDPPDETMLF
jgi:hypothetical protein